MSRCPHVGRTPPRCCVVCWRRTGRGRPEAWRYEQTVAFAERTNEKATLEASEEAR